MTQLDDSALTLNTSARMVHGVVLSEDQTGVTATVSLSNITISVFFDGYTTQIYLKGVDGHMSLVDGKLCQLNITHMSCSVVNRSRSCCVVFAGSVWKLQLVFE